MSVASEKGPATHRQRGQSINGAMMARKLGGNRTRGIECSAPLRLRDGRQFFNIDGWVFH
jgi:hypothetical protein